MNGDYALSMVEGWWLLGVVVGVIILSAIVSLKEDKDVQKWLQKEAPDVMEDYENILAERKRLKKLYKKYGKKEEKKIEIKPRRKKSSTVKKIFS